jgi:hypothetical protein
MSAEPSVLTGERTGKRYRPLVSRVDSSNCMGRDPFVFSNKNSCHRARPAVASCLVVYKRKCLCQPCPEGKKTIPKPRTNQAPSALADAGHSTLPPHNDTCTLRRSGHHLRTHTPHTWGLSGVPQSLVLWKTLSRLSWPNKQWQISLSSWSLVAWGRRRIPFVWYPVWREDRGVWSRPGAPLVQIRSADPHRCF